MTEGRDFSGIIEDEVSAWSGTAVRPGITDPDMVPSGLPAIQLLTTPGLLPS